MEFAGGRNKRGVVLGTGAIARELCPSTRECTGATLASADPELRQQLQQTQEELQQLRQQCKEQAQQVARFEALLLELQEQAQLAARFEAILREQQELVCRLLADRQQPQPTPPAQPDDDDD